MKKFSFRRLALLLRRDLLGDYKCNLTTLLTFYILNLLFISFTYYTPSRYGVGDTGLPFTVMEQGLAIRCVAMATGLLFVGFFGMAGSTFSDLSTKQKRTAVLTLPATNAERYWSRLLQTLVLFPLALVATFVLADLTRMLVFPVFGHSFCSATPLFFSTLGEGFKEMGLLLVNAEHSSAYQLNCAGGGTWGFFLLTGMLVLLHSYYLLGAAVFRRRAPIYATLILLAVCILLGATVSYSSGQGVQVTVSGKLQFIKAYIVLQWLIAITFYILSYQLYKRIPVISRKILR